MNTFYFSKKQLFFVFISLLFSFTIKAQVGIGNTSPNADALLEIGNATTTTAGLLLPRVNLTGTANTNPLSAHVQGMVVFNKANVDDVSLGFYYNDGTKWVRLDSAVDDDWKTTGNSGTDDTVNYIGTNDEEDLVFSADGNEYMRLSWDTGFFGINTTAAEEFLDVNGDIDFGGGPDNYDSQGENIKFRAQSQTWFAAAENKSNASESSFYIGTTQTPGGAQFMIMPNGFVNIGSDDSSDPNDMLHVTKDHDDTTTIRIDNTNTDGSTSLELWDGSHEMSFFKHNNNTEVLEIGHARSNGKVEFYAGHGGSGTTSSDLTMTLEGDADFHVTIETVLNLKPGSAPANPTNGDIYYDSSTDKLRLFAAGSWTNLN